MTNGNTSKLSIPSLSQFRAAYQKGQRSVKRRIESKVPGKSTEVIDSHNIVEISTEGELEKPQLLIHYQMKQSALTLKTMKARN